MRKGRRNLQVLLVGAILMIVAMSIAFAALSTTLNITANTVKNSTTVTWNIGFQGSSATATVGGTSATGRVCGDATITPTTVTVATTTLSKPDDSCTYALTIKNSGTITGTLANITQTKPTGVTCSGSTSSMVCGNITYKLTTDSDGQVALTTGGTLAANATRTVYLVIKYTGTELSSTAISQSAAAFGITYNQT